MAITPDDVAAWQRDGLDLGDAADRQVIADWLVDQGREADLALIDDHADLVAMALALRRQAQQSLRAVADAHERFEVEWRRFNRVVEALYRARGMFLFRRRWAWLKPDERDVVLTVLRERGHVAETMKVSSAGTKRKTLALLLDGRQVTHADGSKADADRRAHPGPLPTKGEIQTLCNNLCRIDGLVVGAMGTSWVDRPRRLDLRFGHVHGYVDLWYRVFTMDVEVPNVLRAKVQQVRDIVDAWRDQVGG